MHCINSKSEISAIFVGLKIYEDSESIFLKIFNRVSSILSQTINKKTEWQLLVFAHNGALNKKLEIVIFPNFYGVKFYHF